MKPYSKPFWFAVISLTVLAWWFHPQSGRYQPLVATLRQVGPAGSADRMLVVVDTATGAAWMHAVMPGGESVWVALGRAGGESLAHLAQD